jgi:hypothetical protein
MDQPWTDQSWIVTEVMRLPFLRAITTSMLPV